MVLVRKDHVKRIDLWEAVTDVSPEERAGKLFAKLTGEAFDKLRDVCNHPLLQMVSKFFVI